MSFKKLKFLCYLLAVFVLSCSTDDDSGESSNIQTDVKKEDLLGVWTIYSVESDGVKAEVPVNFETCGRDFFIYNEDYSYSEFQFLESSTCQPSEFQLKWSLNRGVIELSTVNGSESQLIEINSLNTTTFIFTTRMDLNGDGSLEVYKLTALKYNPPNEMDIYTDSFSRRTEPPFEDHITFRWDIYTGYNTFLRYEIYRSTEECDITSAELVQTIEDVNVSRFIDYNPPTTEGICYFLKIYTDKGLLGISNPRYVATEFILPESVKVINATDTESSVALSWEKYKGYYFSHYEVRVQDQNQNSMPHIETVAIIEDVNTTLYTDVNPPYVNNPIYSIYVHNIFGNTSQLNQDGNLITTNFSRPELLSFDYIRFLSFDPDEQALFFYGVNPDNTRRLIKYDYINHNVLAEGYKLPSVQTDVEMKLITSNEGKELILEQGGEYWVYDASDLTFKYSLNLDFIGPRDSFSYLKNGIWVFSDDDHVFTYKRTGSTMEKIDQKLHFTKHQGGGNYEITKLDNANVLLSHNNEGRAIHYSIDKGGFIANKGIIQIPLLATLNSDLSVNMESQLLLNKKRNSVYSISDFSKTDSYTNPRVTFNFNRLGTKIFGVDKNEKYTGSYEDYSKEIVVYDIEKKYSEKITTKGYPLYVVEDAQGNIISLSSGFPRDEYYDLYNNNVPDMFIEIVK
ncbi:hypothetical protein [Tamlana crocina]|uniref:hypothetical protein n=1 Tax=Tamlana crocina TaxID=393006 RepID=UPI001ADDE625|nr:hypothetical protein [Tamlana crocina]